MNKLDTGARLSILTVLCMIILTVDVWVHLSAGVIMLCISFLPPLEGVESRSWLWALITGGQFFAAAVAHFLKERLRTQLR